MTSRAGFVLGAALCGYIAVSLCIEVASRYLFGAPTQWANPFSNYALAIAIFAALPEMTRRGAHISVNILLARVPGSVARVLEPLILVISSGTTLTAAWISAVDTWKQYEEGVLTMSAIAVPKWWVSIFIAFGLASAAIHFLRELPASGRGRTQTATL
jgi:TRAP-type C4-dicarboxylate transport system permease small subunit